MVPCKNYLVDTSEHGVRLLSGHTFPAIYWGLAARTSRLGGDKLLPAKLPTICSTGAIKASGKTTSRGGEANEGRGQNIAAVRAAETVLNLTGDLNLSRSKRDSDGRNRRSFSGVRKNRGIFTVIIYSPTGPLIQITHSAASLHRTALILRRRDRRSDRRNADVHAERYRGGSLFLGKETRDEFNKPELVSSYVSHRGSGRIAREDYQTRRVEITGRSARKPLKNLGEANVPIVFARGDQRSVV